jgi:clan AA aspartic protease
VIVGEVSPYREAIIRLKLRGASGRQEEVEAVIDTGFTDFLTLPLALIRSLGLARAGTVRVTLADASQVDLEAYLAELFWDGRVRTVSALATDGEPLVGMSLLYGHELKLWVVDGGSVIIERFP